MTKNRSHHLPLMSPGSCVRASTLALLFLAAPCMSAEVVIHDIANLTSTPRVSKLCDSVTTYFAEYFTAKKIKTTRKKGPPDTTGILSPGEALVYGSIYKKGSRTFLSAKIRLGLEKMGKEVALDSHDDAERNAGPAIDAIFSVFESKYISNVQILAEPEGASLTIDNESAGQSPWEAPMVHGRHDLRISKDGYKTVEDHIFVSQSDTKFKFVMAPIVADDSSLIRKARAKRRYCYLSFGGAGLFGAAVVISHAVYANADSHYNRPALPPSDYQKYAVVSRNSLILRNIAIGAAGICCIAGVVLYF